MADEKPDDAKKAEGTEGAEGEDGVKTSKKKKLIIIGGAVLALVLLGGGGYFFFMGGDAPTPDTSEQTENTAEDSSSGTANTEKSEEGEEKTSGDESKKASEDDDTPPPNKYGDTFEIKPFNLNLGNPLENRYIRLVVSLEYKGGEAQKQELTAKTSKIRDVVVNITTKKTMEFLLGPDGKDHLRHELFVTINQSLEKKIEAVYITDMLIE